MGFFGNHKNNFLIAMKHYLSFLFLLIICSCSNETSYVVDNSEDVDWGNENQCNLEIDYEFINEIINKMTLEQKVGQIIMPDLDEVTPEGARLYQLGTILNGGGKFPNKNKNSTVLDWKKLSKDFYNASPIVDGTVVPILWGTDAVHGHNNVIGATIFPHNIGLGSTMNPSLIEHIGKVVAKELLSTGIAWTFAPTIAVPQNDLWGRTYEGYSENPYLVSDMGKAMILGLQGYEDNFLGNDHVLATAKHFLGDGGTENGVDQGNTILSELDFKETHGTPYYAAINACIQTIMASFNSWNGVKMHGNEYLLSSILRDEMGFDGLVVGDWNGHSQIPGCSKESCPESFNAGVDIFMAPDDWITLYKNTLDQVISGVISEERLDDAVRNILHVKQLLGLFDGRKPHEYPYNFIGSAEHKEVARQAVRESIVLLKNNDNILPIKAGQHILVVGEASQQIKSQMGGWTITWQGRENNNNEFPNTLSIYEAISKEAILNNSTIEYSNDASYEQKPDLVIFVYGEDPYAEGDGDRKTLFYINQDNYFNTFMKDISDQEINSLSLFISGRPLVINKELNLSDSFVQVWLPGSAVEGITDVIFSDKNNNIKYDFKGKLSYSWPKLSTQSSLNFTDDGYDPLFNYGYGLTYEDSVFIDQINAEESIKRPNEITVFMGSAYPSYREVISFYNSEKKKILYEGISTDIFMHTQSGINISKFDFLKQDDAKKIIFGKNEISKSWEVTSGSSEDLSYMTNGTIQIILRANNIANKSIFLTLGCIKNDYQILMSGNKDCLKTFDISEFFKEDNLNEWQILDIPLSCLEGNKFELSALTTRTKLETEGNWEFDIHSIKYLNQQGYNSCTSNIRSYE